MLHDEKKKADQVAVSLFYFHGGGRDRQNEFQNEWGMLKAMDTICMPGA